MASSTPLLWFRTKVSHKSLLDLEGIWIMALCIWECIHLLMSSVAKCTLRRWSQVGGGPLKTWFQRKCICTDLSLLSLSLSVSLFLVAMGSAPFLHASLPSLFCLGACWTGPQTVSQNKPFLLCVMGLEFSDGWLRHPSLSICMHESSQSRSLRKELCRRSPDLNHGFWNSSNHVLK